VVTLGVENLKKQFCAFLFLTSYLLLLTSEATAQNMPHEIGFWFAMNGQKPLITPNEINHGFFTNPTIEHLYYSFASNGVQSVSFFIENVNETRPWSGTWATYASGKNPDYPASVEESLGMTTIGFETLRNFISEGGFRLGAGLGVGFGLGGTSANVRDSATGLQTTYSSATLWDALLVDFFVRARYTVYQTNSYEVAIQLMGRYWSFPAIGPTGDGGNAYNGPGLRAISELGYMGGVAVGF
jgi:hypothetical protein